MSNSYFTASSAIADFTRARASQVNCIATDVEAAFDLLPLPTALTKVVRPAVTAGGPANALTVTNAVQITTYELGQKAAFVAAHTNTGSTTINVDGIGVVSLVQPDGSDSTAGDIVAGRVYEAMYNGTGFQILYGDYIMSAAGAAALDSWASAQASAASSSASAAGSSQTTAEDAQSAAETAQSSTVSAAAPFTPSALLTDLKTVDGPSSGLDADLLRGATPGAGGLAVLAAASTAAVKTELGISEVSDTDIAITGAFLLPDGSESAPSLTNAGDTDTGIYFGEDDGLYFTCGNDAILLVANDGVTMPPSNNDRLLLPDGSISAPSLAFASAPDTGMYRSATNTVRIVRDGDGDAQYFEVGPNRPVFGNCDVINIASSFTPSSASTYAQDAGNFSWDTNYFYVSVGSSAWKRLALSTW